MSQHQSTFGTEGGCCLGTRDTLWPGLSLWVTSWGGGCWGPGASRPALCARLMVCTSNWSGPVSLAASTSRCQQLGRLGSMGSYWADWVSVPSCWRDPACTDVGISLYTLTSGPPSSSSREERRMRPLVLSVWVLCMSVFVICVARCVRMYIHAWCIRVLCVRVPTRCTCSALMLVGPGSAPVSHLLPDPHNIFSTGNTFSPVFVVLSRAE